MSLEAAMPYAILLVTALVAICPVIAASIQAARLCCYKRDQKKDLEVKLWKLRKK